MEQKQLLAELKNKYGVEPDRVTDNGSAETYLVVRPEQLKTACLGLHKLLASPVMMFFATDERAKEHSFSLYVLFLGIRYRKWFFITTKIPADNPVFDSLSKEIYSATFFEREMKEMFGLEPQGNPEKRRLRLHEEVWPAGNYPLCKDFSGVPLPGELSNYTFSRVEGEGVLAVPVGPIHAGIIGPGHFNFCVAGEPIIKLGIRLGFTHRGVEKLLEGKTLTEGVAFSECIAGDSAFAHSWAFCQASEKITGLQVSDRAWFIRAICLELERMYNHVADIGGIALDVGFSFPATEATIIKEKIQVLNESFTGSRFLKGMNTIGGVTKDLDEQGRKTFAVLLPEIRRDFGKLRLILTNSVSFLDRVETTGVLAKKLAEDLGVVGLVGRASGIPLDLRQNAAPAYAAVNFKMMTEKSGDVLARLTVRFNEFEESARVITNLLAQLSAGELAEPPAQTKEGFGLGAIEGWRGPVLYWLKLTKGGVIDRCKIVDPSFHNWPALAYAVQENIIPDFPVCNKSFNLSYAGHDL